MNREMAIQWLEKAEEVDKGDQLFIPVDNKKEATAGALLLRNELKILEAVNPTLAGTMTVKTTFRESRFWIIVEKVEINPLIGFVRKKKGGTVRIMLTESILEERRRLIKLMVADGLEESEIIENIGELSEDELDFINTERGRVQECREKDL